jgi:hypothetical protein
MNDLMLAMNVVMQFMLLCLVVLVSRLLFIIIFQKVTRGIWNNMRGLL